MNLETIGSDIAKAGAALASSRTIGTVEAIADGVVGAIGAINAAVTEGKAILEQAQADPAVWEACRARFGAKLDALKASFAAHPGL